MEITSKDIKRAKEVLTNRGLNEDEAQDIVSDVAWALLERDIYDCSGEPCAVGLRSVTIFDDHDIELHMIGECAVLPPDGFNKWIWKKNSRGFEECMTQYGNELLRNILTDDENSLTAYCKDNGLVAVRLISMTYKNMDAIVFIKESDWNKNAEKIQTALSELHMVCEDEQEAKEELTDWLDELGVAYDPMYYMKDDNTDMSGRVYIENVITPLAVEDVLVQTFYV